MTNTDFRVSRFWRLTIGDRVLMTRGPRKGEVGTVERFECIGDDVLPRPVVSFDNNMPKGFIMERHEYKRID